MEKFNPGARQLINAGKAYLKALHGEYNFPFCSQFSSLLFIQNLKSSFSPSNIKGALANIYEHYFFQFYYRTFLMNIAFEYKTFLITIILVAKSFAFNIRDFFFVSFLMGDSHKKHIQNIIQ